MKVAKWAILLPIVLFPYGFWVTMWLKWPGWEDLWLLLWPLGLAGALFIFCFSRKGEWDTRSIALANMAVKLLQIPAYVLWFILGASMFLFGFFAVSFVVDAMTIVLSGLVGLAAVLRCRKAGILTRSQAVRYGVLQFVFCVDVVSAIILYGKTKEVSL